LPIEPEKIHALLFKGVVKNVHVIRRKSFVRDIERNIFLCGRIDFHCASHFRIVFFKRLHA